MEHGTKILINGHVCVPMSEEESRISLPPNFDMAALFLWKETDIYRDGKGITFLGIFDNPDAINTAIKESGASRLQVRNGFYLSPCNLNGSTEVVL